MCDRLRFCMLGMVLSALLCQVLFAGGGDSSGAEEGLVGVLEGKRVAFLGDSITQDGRYVSFVTYYLNRLYPAKEFSIYGLGLGSETVSGLSEEGHAGGAFPRPCLFDRLGPLLEKLKPEVVFACYGMNDAIYQPLDSGRFAAYKRGVRKLVTDCRAAGVGEIFLITPPIYDDEEGVGAAGYDDVLAAYGEWLLSLRSDDLHVIDLHGPMRKARDARAEPLAGDKVHPGDEGHLLMGRVVLDGLGVVVPEEGVETIQGDPMFKLVDRLRRHRWDGWMRHIGYTREKTVEPQALGDSEEEAKRMQEEINVLRGDL